MKRVGVDHVYDVRTILAVLDDTNADELLNERAICLLLSLVGFVCVRESSDVVSILVP